MSEYQSFEFQALDQPLTPEEMAELRRWSSRAEITPTRFWNEYNWGDFKGNPRRWMECYFDAFLHVALADRIPALNIRSETGKATSEEDADQEGACRMD